MTTATDAPHELDHRVADGIHVTLLWYPATNRVTVEVYDETADHSFELEVAHERALDAFHHPFAYAALEGVRFTGIPAAA